MTSEIAWLFAWAILAGVCGAGIWLHGEWISAVVGAAMALAAWKLLEGFLDAFYPSHFDDEYDSVGKR